MNHRKETVSIEDEKAYVWFNEKHGQYEVEYMGLETVGVTRKEAIDEMWDELAEVFDRTFKRARTKRYDIDEVLEKVNLEIKSAFEASEEITNDQTVSLLKEAS